MSGLRLLQVSEPGKDGVFDVVNSIIRQIHEKHPEITVDLAYSSRRGGPGLEALLPDIRRHGGCSLDLNVGNAPSPADFAAIVRLLDLIRKRRPQLIHAHSSKAGALVRLARLCSPLGFPPILYTPHAYYGMACLGTMKERVFDLVETVLGHIGTTVCTSQDERLFAIRHLHLPPSRIRVVENGVETSRFAPPLDAAEQVAARESLGLPLSGKLLVTVGRDSLQKNYPPLYDALDALLPDSDWYFAHAGAGSIELREQLGKAARSRCFAFRHLSDIPLFLKAADGFVMTSRYEGLSLAMLEALSAGLPSFLPDAPGFQFLKTDSFDRITWLPDPADATRLTQRLLEVLGGWGYRPAERLLGQRRLVEEHFSLPVQIEKFITLYQALALPGH